MRLRDFVSTAQLPNRLEALYYLSVTYQDFKDGIRDGGRLTIEIHSHMLLKISLGKPYGHVVLMGFYGGFMGLYGMYPLVICYVAIENGHRILSFPMKNCGSFHCYLK